jgi:4'-phosphopantetheinyl transferase EntD
MDPDYPRAALAEVSSPIGLLADCAAAHGILMGFRYIGVGDEFNLVPGEAAAFTKSVAKVRRQSGAARIVARDLLQRFGAPPCAIPKSNSGAPIWPSGIVGSLAHDEMIAVAAIARKTEGFSIGIDIEVEEPLPDELSVLIATGDERRRYSPQILKRKLLFVLKEAVYKASFPLDGRLLDFQDVEVDLDNHNARTLYGITAKLILSEGRHIAAIAITGR